MQMFLSWQPAAASVAARPTGHALVDGRSGLAPYRAGITGTEWAKGVVEVLQY